MRLPLVAALPAVAMAQELAYFMTLQQNAQRLNATAVFLLNPAYAMEQGPATAQPLASHAHHGTVIPLLNRKSPALTIAITISIVPVITAKVALPVF